MKTRILLTVDVEPSFAGALEDPDRCRPRLHEPVWGGVGGRSQALGFLMETLSRHGLSGTFFVETAHTAYFGEEEMGEYARRLARAGHDVQLHLHPAWRVYEPGPGNTDARRSDDCSDLDRPTLARLMRQGCVSIRNWTDVSPVGFRPGNFYGSRGVYRAMADAGLRIASNVCVGVARPADRTLWAAGGVHDFEGITELPVTCFRDRGPVGRGAFRPLQVTACGFHEMRMQLDAVHRAGGSTAVILTHPFEFLKWSGDGFAGLRRNRMVQRRFDRLCRYLSDNTDRFEVVSLPAVLESEPEPEPPIQLDGRASLSLWRAIENFANDRLPV